MNESFIIMGVQPGAPPEVIRRAYRDLVRVWHPDRFSHDDRLRALVEERLKEINTAYESLMKSPSRRLERPFSSQPRGKAAQSSKTARHETFRLGDGVSLSILSVPGGSFLMGSHTGEIDETPVRQVTVSPFLLGRTPVTREQYIAVTGENPSRFYGESDLPVEQVCWEDAVRFCNLLSDLAGFRRCYREHSRTCDFSADGFRLPTEAEWEYACRAGTTADFFGGVDETALDAAGWYRANGCGRTRPVGRKRPNEWGLFDMHGNVWEWTNDWYGPYPARDEIDPAGPPSGIFRVKRGGGWSHEAALCRSSYRSNFAPRYRDHLTGFRVTRRG